MKILIGVFLLVPALALAAPSPMAAQEISHLFSYLKDSSCAFNRNNAWHTPTDAVAHLQNKYEYLVRKDRILSAEDFIEQAATESSMSGKPYLVKCADGIPVKSAIWFKDELARYRNKSQHKH